MTYRRSVMSSADERLRQLGSKEHLQQKIDDQNKKLLALYRENEMLRRKARVWKELARAFRRGYMALGGGKPSSP